ncbi:MAG: bifunctional riboflavin kinase/FAD synthetase [Ruminococcaceae bacterium]|nr:bifunctional riboflavin kinase/FAD synthetase [Oscillospiraceae bacterium]
MILYDLKRGREIEKIDLPLSVVLGCFDGLHLGHCELIGTARSKKDPVCAFTFSKNPFGAPYITTAAEKRELLFEAGVDYCAMFDFEEIRDLPWDSFIRDILIGTLDLKTAVCGFNFRFGKNAEGNTDNLSRLLASAGRECIIVPPFSLGGETVSSSRIRGLIGEGDLEKAALLLGRSYFVSGKVCRGNGIGSGLGFPTVNIAHEEGRVMPEKGVYVSRCMGHAAITNFGTRPTVTDKNELFYETFIFDYNEDLYGRNVKVELLRMLRPEKRFDSKKELTEQITRDVESAKEYFKKQTI